MDMIQIAARYIFEPLVARREGSDHLQILRRLEKTQFLSRAELEKLQLERLAVILKHAYKNCPFYRERFDRAGFKPGKLGSLDDIETIPPLTKAEIQQHRDKMIAVNIDEKDLVANQTGGSTGAPLKFYHNRQRLFSRKAATMRHDRWAGWEIGSKTGVLWGNRVDFSAGQGWKAGLRRRLWDRRLILDTSHITGERLRRFIDDLRHYRPRVILAYANAVYLLARFIKENNITAYHRPRGIITSAELFHGFQRELIEEVFGCPVFDRYGCRETSIIASECSEHSGLHINAESLLVEFRDKNGRCRNGRSGQIVITDLLNFGMPFIRYRIEDIGTPLDTACSCGRGLPLMKMAGGRVTDFIVTPENKIVSGAAMTIYFVAETPGIAQAQLVQKRKDFLLIRLVRDDSFGDTTHETIKMKMAEFFGRNMHYEIEFVESIPVEPSGKYRFSISEIDPLEYLS